MLSIEFTITILSLVCICISEMIKTSEYTSFSWIHLLFMNTPPFHEYTFFSWIHLVFMNVPPFHEYTSFSWIHLLFMNTLPFHEYTFFSWIHLLFMNLPPFHEFTSFSVYINNLLNFVFVLKIHNGSFAVEKLIKCLY